jgi:hypothetical protein
MFLNVIQLKDPKEILNEIERIMAPMGQSVLRLAKAEWHWLMFRKDKRVRDFWNRVESLIERMNIGVERCQYRMMKEIYCNECSIERI